MFFEIEDGSGLWEVGGYFLEPPDAVLLEVLATAFGAKPFALSELPEVDWVAHVPRELSPVDAGRFFVFGSHDAGTGCRRAGAPADRGDGGFRHRPPRHDPGLPPGLRPAADGGLGGLAAWPTSAAARRCWRWRRRPCRRRWSSPATSTGWLWTWPRRTSRSTGWRGRVECLEAAGLDDDRIRAAGPFDLVFANILKGPLIELAPDIASSLATGGRAVLSGLLAVQADLVVEAYVASQLSLNSRDDISANGRRWCYKSPESVNNSGRNCDRR